MLMMHADDASAVCWPACQCIVVFQQTWWKEILTCGFSHHLGLYESSQMTTMSTHFPGVCTGDDASASAASSTCMQLLFHLLQRLGLLVTKL
jgi:hypothetical protein